MNKHTVHLICPETGAALASVKQMLEEHYTLERHDSWTNTYLKPESGSNGLFQPICPLLVFADELTQVTMEKTVKNVERSEKELPVLYISKPSLLDKLKPLMTSQDDFIAFGCEQEELLYKLEQIIFRCDQVRKLTRDLKEASDIALLSMSNSSELGEISRFILKSYSCENFEELMDAIFETLNIFNLQCSALIVVDDQVCERIAEGKEAALIKEKLLNNPYKGRITKLGKEMIVSYPHVYIMAHDMPIFDDNCYGRLTDNLSVLGNCFEARVDGIHSEQELNAAGQAKTMFLATMSHELRTPMNSVIGYTQRLIKKLDGRLNEKEQRHLQAIKRNGDHLLSVINDILDMSKIEIGQMEIHPESMDVVPILTNVYDQLMPIAKNNDLTLKLELAINDKEISADPQRVTQIMMNLLSNAIKYTEKGSVTVGLDCGYDDEIGECVFVAIRDTGIGISEEDQKKLFGNFIQIDSAHSRKVEGTGLGLAISDFFATSHGGRIDVDSAEGAGSCFTLILPVHAKYQSLESQANAHCQTANPVGTRLSASHNT
ncbi:MAG: hypothetical protein COA42_04340 [Alteromonadaceae bacterium]|nr:MAG: hypothetical protein COA42_04340 [Alteromonadaceae bacterium]